jgi:hypothetical protein
VPYGRRVRLQLRASNMRAPYGLTYWSDPVQLDSLGGAAVVSVPTPSAAPSSQLHNPRATYMLAVTANQVNPAMQQSHQGGDLLAILSRSLSWTRKQQNTGTQGRDL